MTLLIPYFLSLTIGILALNILFSQQNRLSLPLFLALAFLTGMAESIFICFLGFLIFNRFHLPFIISAHLIEILIFLAFHIRRPLTKFRSAFKIPPLDPDLLIVLSLVGFLSWLYSSLYPNGGWDAWQVWNFKSKFLLLSGSRWKDLFDPILWRSSPHYPLALPLWNAWTAACAPHLLDLAARLNAILLNILTALVMFSTVRQYSNSRWIILPVLLPFTMPSYMLLATNQYADLFITVFFLASLTALFSYHRTHDVAFLAITGIFLGILSFTKPEGVILAAIIFLTGHMIFQRPSFLRRDALLFWIATGLALVPAAIFFLFLSPGNQTFFNGLISTEHPSTLSRLTIIFIFLGREILGMHGGGLWGLILLSALLNFKQAFQKKFALFFLPIILYLSVVGTYYWINTRFEILWWLSVSLKRILNSLIPAAVTWIILAICSQKKSSSITDAEARKHNPSSLP